MSSDSRRRLRQKGRSDKDAKHVRLYHVMIKGEAWQSLCANARALYLEIADRYGGPGSNNGRIHYAVREGATTLHVSKDTASAALDQLEDRGFIVAETRGKFDRKVRHATEWRLTAYSSDISGALPTRDYERWRAQIQNTVPVVGPLVPVAVPNGPRSRTEAA